MDNVILTINYFLHDVYYDDFTLSRKYTLFNNIEKNYEILIEIFTKILLILLNTRFPFSSRYFYKLSNRSL